MWHSNFVQSRIELSDTGELVLLDGRRIGTRQMRRYYKQVRNFCFVFGLKSPAAAPLMLSPCLACFGLQHYRPDDQRASTQSALGASIQRMSLLLAYEGAGVPDGGSTQAGNARALAVAVAKGRGGKAGGGLMGGQKTRAQHQRIQFFKDRHYMSLGVKANKLYMVDLKIHG
jgi:hypothetical protein